MGYNNQLKMIRKFLCAIMLWIIFFVSFGVGGLPLVHAQSAVSDELQRASDSELTGGNALSDGQFVYGPNVGDFNVNKYFEINAPHLMKYADDLYGRAEYYSINPRVYLTLMEIHSHIISAPSSVGEMDFFGLNNSDFISQVDELSNKMSAAYYLHLYTYSALPALERGLPPFITPEGIIIQVTSDTNAGTYAIIAGLAAMGEKNISVILDNDQADGFDQTYKRLFGNDDPLDKANHIHILGEANAQATPDNFLQIPLLQGLAWKFGGVHDNSGGRGVGSSLTDASSIDFYPADAVWGMDTSNMWVVAAASGILTAFPSSSSTCGIKVSHSGIVNTGWETTYYHLENVQKYSGIVKQNDKLAVIADTYSEATCVGGAASGPHVHFSLKYNGALVAINGTPLSGWYVHAGRFNYDVNPNYMWLEREGQKKYPFNDVVLSESTILFDDVYTGYWADGYIRRLYKAGITGGCGANIYCPESTVTRAQMSVFLLKGMHGPSYTPPAVGVETGFADVAVDYWAAAWIKQLAVEGITGGCGNGSYCPDATVTRAQMSIFLLKAKYGASYSPPSATGKFKDVPMGYWADKWVERLATEGVTSGCSGDIYCPDVEVTRAQMAVFLVKMFNIP